jgi:hypothetical protein
MMRDQALYYASLGWPIFRLSPNSKKPIKGSHGFKDATNDRAIIDTWYKQTPEANIALATGQIIVLDADGPGGFAQIQELARPHGGLPVTKVGRTPRVGLHFLYTAPSGVIIRCYTQPRKKDEHDGLDIKGVGGFIVLPPSRTNDGTYVWVNDAPIAIMPDWLVEWCLAKMGERRGSRPPWSQVDQERLQSALKFIPSAGYDDWIHVGMALHELDSRLDDGTSIGFRTWVQWSV